jgi:hypothetical protein
MAWIVAHHKMMSGVSTKGANAPCCTHTAHLHSKRRGVATP